jgi:hydroxysqualene synthase
MPSMGVNHYENFPVASILCPPALRAPITAIYHFARTADDIADEGLATPQSRLAELEGYEQMLLRAAHSQPAHRWPRVFQALAAAMQSHALPLAPLQDLLSAFKQDTGNPVYANRAELLDYCRRSANPVGRLLLHLAHIELPQAQAESDAICTALQLINFWQDLSVDLPRGRHYVCNADLLRHGLQRAALEQLKDTPASRTLVRELVDWARSLMHEGAPLVHRMPGRMGWELRLVVQGGLRILDKIEASGFNALSRRPTLGWKDAPVMLWRAFTMKNNLARPAALRITDS